MVVSGFVLRRSILLALISVGCSSDRPTVDQCHEAIAHFMVIQLPTDGTGSDTAFFAKALTDAPADDFDQTCHDRATTSQVRCLDESKTIADVRACVVVDKDWDWLQPLLRIAFVGVRR